MDRSVLTQAIAGGGARFHKWTEQGQVLRGRVLEVEVEQERVFGSTDLAYWPDGKPRCRVVLTLQTDTATDEQDDGVRRLAVPMYGKHLDRLRKAVKAAGAADLTAGQAFAARWTSGVGGAGDPRIIDYHLAPAPTPAANTDHDVEPHDLEATEPAHATHHDAPAF